MILLNLIVEDKDHNKKVFLIVKVVQEQENNAEKNEMVVMTKRSTKTAMKEAKKTMNPVITWTAIMSLEYLSHPSL